MKPNFIRFFGEEIGIQDINGEEIKSGDYVKYSYILAYDQEEKTHTTIERVLYCDEMGGFGLFTIDQRIEKQWVKGITANTVKSSNIEIVKEPVL